MKTVFVSLLISLTALSASAKTLSCTFAKAKNGTIVESSKPVQVKGNVEIEFIDFKESDGITARLSGDPKEELHMFITQQSSDITAYSGYSENNSLNLLTGTLRFALYCTK
jgi:hypothetical protein